MTIGNARGSERAPPSLALRLARARALGEFAARLGRGAPNAANSHTSIAAARGRVGRRLAPPSSSCPPRLETLVQAPPLCCLACLYRSKPGRCWVGSDGLLLGEARRRARGMAELRSVTSRAPSSKSGLRLAWLDHEADLALPGHAARRDSERARRGLPAWRASDRRPEGRHARHPLPPHPALARAVVLLEPAAVRAAPRSARQRDRRS